MENIWIALGIILMILPVLYVLREEFYTSKVLILPIYTEIDSYTGKIYAEILRSSDNYDAIVLEFSSPGGTLGGVREVIDAIKELKEKDVIIVSYIKEEALSGAYWIAAYSDYIFADNYSLVGNVGVTASFLNFAGFLDRFNISYVEIYNGSMKEIGSPFKKPTEEEINRLKKIVNEVYSAFLNDVARLRNLTEEQKKIVGTSDIFLGFEAKNLSLVDYIGNLEDVKDFLKEKLKKEIKFEYPDFSRYLK